MESLDSPKPDLMKIASEVYSLIALIDSVAKTTIDKKESVGLQFSVPMADPEVALREQMDYLRLCIKYTVLDLEAMRRENKYLLKVIEDSANE